MPASDATKSSPSSAVKNKLGSSPTACPKSDCPTISPVCVAKGPFGKHVDEGKNVESKGDTKEDIVTTWETLPGNFKDINQGDNLMMWPSNERKHIWKASVIESELTVKSMVGLWRIKVKDSRGEESWVSLTGMTCLKLPDVDKKKDSADSRPQARLPGLAWRRLPRPSPTWQRRKCIRRFAEMVVVPAPWFGPSGWPIVLLHPPAMAGR